LVNRGQFPLRFDFAIFGQGCLILSFGSCFVGGGDASIGLCLCLMRRFAVLLLLCA
jgi:hypothetical protein